MASAMLFFTRLNEKRGNGELSDFPTCICFWVDITSRVMSCRGIWLCCFFVHLCKCIIHLCLASETADSWVQFPLKG